MWVCYPHPLGVFTPNPTMLTHRLFYACGVEKVILVEGRESEALENRSVATQMFGKASEARLGLFKRPIRKDLFRKG